MYFPDSWYEDEVRDGFYVPALMKRSWAAQMDVLEQVAKVCEKHHIRWFAGYGTLLGAVRHGGFIPWDDDLDIIMFRDDYQRFNAVAQKELPDEYYIPQDVADEFRYFTRICNRSVYCVDPALLEKCHGFPYASGIDIFPFDYLAPDPETEEFRTSLAIIAHHAAWTINDLNQDTEEMQALAAQVEALLDIKLDRRGSLKNQLFALSESLFSLYTADQAREAAYMPFLIFDNERPYPLDCFGDTVMLPFETARIPAPAGYVDILTCRYGDYRTLIRSGSKHDYPGHLPQAVQLANLLGKERLPFQYTLSKADLESAKPGHTLHSIHDDIRASREIVFLPWKASMWEGMEPYWKEAASSQDCSVYVIPLPWFYRNVDGSLRDMQYDGESFPDSVPVTDYRSYDFSAHRPDMIFIQNPYDEYNLTTSIAPGFYSAVIKQYTRQLVYIPWFTVDETDPGDSKAVYNMRYYAAMPGVVHADRVILQSELIRKAYVDFLSEFAGEETRKIWEAKTEGGERHAISRFLV